MIVNTFVALIILIHFFSQIFILTSIIYIGFKMRVLLLIYLEHAILHFLESFKILC